MTYKTILVHLDTSTRAHTRLDLALALAHRFHAKLSAVFSTYVPEAHAFVVMAGTAEYFAAHERERQQRCAALERLFHSEVARANIEGQWTTANGYANDVMPPHARLADLIVLGQTDPGDPEAFISEQFVEHIVLSAGRPVLLIPRVGSFDEPGKHVLVAWDGSREATRALHDALPFLSHAAKVTLLSVNAQRADAQHNRIPGADIALTMARHGVKVEVREMEADSDTETGEVLLSQVAERGCDMLVMGAYAHSRLHEVILGGATRTVLRSMTVPVLLSH